MNKKISKASSLPEKLTDILKDVMDPISVAYFTAADENMNFKCVFSATPLYREGQNYSIYNIPSLFRLILSKANILPEKEVDSVFENFEKQFCYILEWVDVKKVLVFDIRELNFFEDQALVKELIKERELIVEALDKAVYE